MIEPILHRGAGPGARAGLTSHGNIPGAQQHQGPRPWSAPQTTVNVS